MKLLRYQHFCRLIYLLIGALLLAAHIRVMPFWADDAYMHFRIARNFLESGAPYFNPGEAVMATSSTLWTLLLTVFLALSGNTLSLLTIVSTAITLAAAFTYARLARLLFGAAAPRLELCAFILTSAALSTASMQGMETPLALLLVGLAFLRYFQSDAKAFALLALACFTRLEVGAFALIIGIDLFRFRRVPLVRAALFFAAAAIPLVIFDLFFFGTLLPQTVTAKAQIYSLSAAEFMTFATAGWLGKYLLFHHPFAVLVLFAALTVTAIYLGFFHLRAPDFVMRDQRYLLPLCAGLFVFLAFAISKVYIFPWYVPLYTLPILFSFLYAAFIKDSLPLRIFTALLTFPLLLTLSRNLTAAFDPSYFEEYEGGMRARAYLHVGASLREECASCSLMAAEVGALGYGFRGKLYDGAGLASPEALKHHQRAKRFEKQFGAVVPPGFVQAASPDYIVGMESFLEDLKASEVSSRYRWQSISLPGLSLGEEQLMILRKKLE